MLIIFYASCALLLAYAILIGYYKQAWESIDPFTATRESGVSEKIKVSVIIAARNEEMMIGHCLQSLAGQSYPRHLLEIIVINDHSTDATAQRVISYGLANAKLINLKDHVDGGAINSYKKKAIETGIALATGELIVTTDADCVAPPDWIRTIAAYYEASGAAFIAAPVKITGNKSLLSIFQAMDFLCLQGITGSSVHKKFHSMCNGANLAYSKKVFYEVGGFKGIDNIASGDDMLLMHKIFLRCPDRVFFLKSTAAIVSTRAESTWKDFIRQRIRWASKADKYEDKRIFAVLILVYLLNLLLLIIVVAALWDIRWLFAFLLLVLSKTIIEYSFVKKVASFFKLQYLMVYFPCLQPLHVVYTVVAGFLGKSGNYRWKGRRVK